MSDAKPPQRPLPRIADHLEPIRENHHFLEPPLGGDRTGESHLFAPEQGHEALPHVAARRGLAEQVEKGRAQVNERDRVGDAPGREAGDAHEQRDVEQFLVQRLLMPERAVLAERLAVIG